MVEYALGIIAVCSLINASLALARETHDRSAIHGENTYTDVKNRGKNERKGPPIPKTPAARAQRWLDNRKGGRK